MAVYRVVLVVVLCLVARTGLAAQGIATWPSFNTAGHPKSNGVELTIKYPLGWAAKEGERPHVVQKFIHPDGLIYVMILIQDLELPPGEHMSREDAEANLAPDELLAIAPAGFRIISAEPTQIEGLPAGIVEYQGVMQRAGQSIEQRVWTLVFIDDRSLVSIQCAVGDLPGRSDLTSRMAAMKPTFQMIANSVVLPDLWLNPAPQAAVRSPASPQARTSASPLESGGNFGSMLLLPLLITWGIGLAPPLLVRFALLRQPMNKPAAIGFVVLFWIVNLVIFTALESENKTHGVLVLIGCASYAILRIGASASPQVQSS